MHRPNIALAVFLIGLSPAVARASSILGRATLDGSVFAFTCSDNCSRPDPTKGTNIGLYNGYTATHNTVNLSTDPSISAYSESFRGSGANPRYVNSSSADITLDYYFEIIGPSTKTLPVSIQASVLAKTVGDPQSATYFAHLAILGSGNAPLDIDRTIESGLFQPPYQNTYENSITINGYYDLVTNHPYEVYMRAIAGTDVSSSVLHNTQFPTSSVTIDPSFTIDPAYGSGYSISYSDGIGATSVSAVPLPASAPMFGAALLALGAAGFGMRRRRHAAVD